MKYKIVFAIFIALIISEAFWLFKKNKYSRSVLKESVVNLTMGFIGILITSALLSYGVTFVLTSLYRFHIFQIPISLYSFVACLIFMDFLYYIIHFYAHRTNIGWAAHLPHHSTRHFNLSVGLRIGWTQHYFALIFIPLPILGFPPELIIVCYAVTGAYQFISHLSVPITFPAVVEYVFITPRVHELHHATNKDYFGKNLGSIFCVWDKFFGTYCTPLEHSPPRFYESERDNLNMLKINFSHYISIAKQIKTAKSWGTRLGYIFRKPGWQPKL